MGWPPLALSPSRLTGVSSDCGPICGDRLCVSGTSGAAKAGLVLLIVVVAVSTSVVLIAAVAAGLSAPATANRDREPGFPAVWAAWPRGAVRSSQPAAKST